MKERLKFQVTEDVWLHQLEATDVNAIFNVINREREYLGKWLPFVASTKKIEDTKSFVLSALEVSEESCQFVFVIRKADELIGLIGFNNENIANRRVEIGYWLSEKYQKQGIMTKAVRHLCQFSFHERAINRIQINCAVGNVQSRKIPERLGFELEGIQRDGELLSNGVFTDLAIYSLLRSDCGKLEENG